MAEYVVEFGKEAGRSNLTAGSMRRRFIAIMSRSGRCCRNSSPANPATWWRPAAAPASMWCISPGIRPRSPGGRAISTRRISKASRRGGRMQACRTSARRCGSISPIRRGARRCTTAAGPAELLAVFCANVIHIAPWRVAEGLFAGAARYLRADGRLFLYGPFKRDGKHTALSNAVFDTSLRENDPEWGVRDIGDLEKLAGGAGLHLIEIVRNARQQSDSGVRPISQAAERDAWRAPVCVG